MTTGQYEHYGASPYPGDYYPPGVGPEFLNLLMQSINGEASDIEFYTRLARFAPSSECGRRILQIADDERKHLGQFMRLYQHLTCRAATPRPAPEQFSDWWDGVHKAWEDEVSAYERYRDMYLMSEQRYIRDILLDAFTDEIKHATILTYMKATRCE